MADLTDTSVLDRVTQADPRRAKQPEIYRVVRCSNDEVLGQTNSLELSSDIAQMFSREGTRAEDPFTASVVRVSDGAEVARFEAEVSG